MLTWSTIQRLSRTGLFIPTSLVSCWLLTLRVWDGGVEHLQRHFSEKINISGNRIQQGKKLVKAQTAVRRICLITLIWEIFFSCFFFFSIQSPLIPTENFPQVSKLQAGATETMSPSKEPTWPPFCCQLLHSQKGFNCCQNYPKRFKQNLLFPVHPWANCYYSCVMDGLYRDHVVEKKDALWQNCISAFCYLYSASHLTDFRLDINEWNNLSQDKNHNFHLELVMLLI